MTGYEKELGNSLYESAVTTGLTCGFAYLGKMIMGITKPSAKLDTSDVLKLVGYGTAAIISKDFMIKKGWIPPTIMK